LPLAPRAQRLRNAQATRAERLRRRKFRRNLFTFIVAQLVIAGVAFVGVRDYMSDGYLKQAVADAVKQIAGGAPETKTAAVQPPPELDTAANEETAAVQEAPEEIEPTPPPVETETALASAPPEPVEQPDEQIASPAVEPESELQQEVEAAPADVDPEPAPPAEVEAVAEPEPEPEPQPDVQIAAPEAAPVAKQVAVAAVPVPDLTTLKNAPSVIEQPGLADSQKEGLIFRDCDGCPELVSIGPGEFMVGPEGRSTAQQAITAVDAKKVVVDQPFAIGRYEITFDDWRQCVDGGGCKGEPVDDGWGRGRRPAIYVSYNDISQQYLPWLSKTTGFTYRLPTEAEWELASQGGNKSSRGGITEVGSTVQLACSYGNSSDVAGKVRETIWAGAACNDGFLYTAPAGSLSPNSLGIYDMHGNVWEWVSDCWRATYDTEETANTESCKYHVLRGGSWASEFRFLPDGVWIGDAVAYRAAVRGWETSVKARNSIGFRVARSLQ